MVSSDDEYSRTHGLSLNLLRLQADAIGIPIIQTRTSWQTYENEFKKLSLALKKQILMQGYLEILIFRDTGTGLKGFAGK